MRNIFGSGHGGEVRLHHLERFASSPRDKPQGDGAGQEWREVREIRQVHRELVWRAHDERGVLHEQLGRIGPERDRPAGRRRGPCDRFIRGISPAADEERRTYRDRPGAN